VKELLPWYVNGTLSAAEQGTVDRRVDQSSEIASEVAEWQLLRAAVSTQSQQRPAPVVWQRVIARVRSSRAARRWATQLPQLAWGGVLALAIVLLLWGSIQPGIVLRWSVNNGPLDAFRIYRAAEGSTDFELVHEIPAQAGAQQYTYVDSLLVPGQTYVYLVEGIGLSSQSTFSQAIAANAIEALPGQLAILLTGLIGGYGAVSLAQRVRVSGRRWSAGQLMI
jgi:hypothetical protein